MNGYLNIRMENKYLDNKKEWKKYYAVDNKGTICCTDLRHFYEA